jgi:hypothetical protein
MNDEVSNGFARNPSRWFFLLPFMALLAGSASAAPPARPTLTVPNAFFDAQAALRWIPFEWTPDQQLIILPVELNGAPARALLDTGAPTVAVARAYALAHHLPLAPTGDAYSVGGMSHFERTDSVALRIGGLYQPAGAVQVVDLSGVNAALDDPVDLVIGSSLISRFALQIDFDHKRLRLLPSGAKALEGVDLPVGLQISGGRIWTQMTIGNRALRVLIDSGSAVALTLSSSTWLSMPHQQGHGITDLAYVGLGGEGVETLLTLGGIRFGSLPPVTALTTIEPSEGILSHIGFPALTGLGLLGNYNLVLDVPAGRMTLASRLRPVPPAPRSTVGVQVFYTADRLKVAHVMSGSPAAGSGLHAGDEICAINGDRITARWKSPPLKDWSLVKAGTRYDLALCDGRHVRLVTRAFY